MKTYLIGLAATLGGITLFATMPFWLPALVVVALLTIVPWRVGQALTELKASRRSRVK